MSAHDPPSMPSPLDPTDGRGPPPWVSRLAVPVWVSDSERRMCWLNEGAARLFGVSASSCAGPPCYQLVAGKDEGGCRFCSPRCSPMLDISRDADLPAVTLEVGPVDRRRWIHTLLIPSVDPEGRASLVHCALDAQRTQRLTRYVRRVAERSAKLTEVDSARLRALTPREFEILERLALDEDLPAIARHLFISVTTVRNHVQHLLAAMGAHSTQEAVARYLLEPGSVDGRGADRTGGTA